MRWALGRVAGRLQNIEFDPRRPFSTAADIQISAATRTVEAGVSEVVVTVVHVCRVDC
jgi:hypothetical protein